MATRRTVVFFAATALLRGADPDFTGSWKLNESRSRIRNSPAPTPRTMQVVMEGTRVTCTGWDDKGENIGDCSVTTDGKARHVVSADRSTNSVAKWEGDALLVNRLVAARSSQHTVMDRWKLSRDGRTLTVSREVETVRGETESLLVYDRQSR